MNPRFLRTFLKVASCRGLTRAAAELHLAQSSVSDQVQTLEDELGATLFVRSRRGVDPTPAGEALIAHAQDVLTALDGAREAVAHASCSSERSVVVGALETIASEVLPRPLAELRRDHPGLRIRIEIARNADLLNQVRDGRVDVAFSFRRGSSDERLIHCAYATEPLVLIGPHDAGGVTAPSDWRALSTTPLIATEPGCVYRHLFDEAWRQAGIEPPTIAAEVGSIRAIVRLVEAGIGFALVPRLAASRALERGSVASYQPPGRALNSTLDMIWRRRRNQPAGLSLFLASMGGVRKPLTRGDVPRRRGAPCLS